MVRQHLYNETCRDMCKFSLWSAEYISNQSTAYFGRISNSIEISFVGRVPGPNMVQLTAVTRKDDAFQIHPAYMVQYPRWC